MEGENPEKRTHTADQDKDRGSILHTAGIGIKDHIHHGIGLIRDKGHIRRGTGQEDHDSKVILKEQASNREHALLGIAS
jgi:hypothetical protein